MSKGRPRGRPLLKYLTYEHLPGLYFAARSLEQVHRPLVVSRVKVMCLPLNLSAFPPLVVHLMAFPPSIDTVQKLVLLVTPIKPCAVSDREGVFPSLMACSNPTFPGVISASAAAALERTE